MSDFLKRVCIGRMVSGMEMAELVRLVKGPVLGLPL